MAKRGPRGNLEANSGSARLGKTLSKGFGIVRFLTPATQRDVFEALSEAEIGPDKLSRAERLHATVIGFVGMSRREQTAFHAGFTVSRLEERLEDGVAETTPRTALSVELGSVSVLGSMLYCDLSHEQLSGEQRNLAGEVALHGINIQRIDRKIVPPHMRIGNAQHAPIEDVRQRVEEALLGQTVALERWKVYPERYA